MTRKARSARLRQMRLAPPTIVALAAIGAVLAAAAGRAPGAPSTAALTFKLDHFLCYSVKLRELNRSAVVLDPQFRPARKTAVVASDTLCNWASKDGSPVRDKRRHLFCYRTRSGQTFRTRQVIVTNQYKDVKLAVVKPNALCLPSGKSLRRVAVKPASTLDHFQCYPVKPLTKVPPQTPTVVDEFGKGEYTLGIPIRLCDPASKNKSPIVNRRDHLLCYKATPAEPARVRRVFVTNQFGRVVPYDPIEPKLLCVPSLKRVVS